MGTMCFCFFSFLETDVVVVVVVLISLVSLLSLLLLLMLELRRRWVLGVLRREVRRLALAFDGDDARSCCSDMGACIKVCPTTENLDEDLSSKSSKGSATMSLAPVHRVENVLLELWSRGLSLLFCPARFLFMKVPPDGRRVVPFWATLGDTCKDDLRC